MVKVTTYMINLYVQYKVPKRALYLDDDIDDV